MSCYHRIATFLEESAPELRAGRGTDLAVLTAAILERSDL